MLHPRCSWCLILFGSLFLTSSQAAEPVSGWRGNGTGLWPEAKVPLEWSRIPRGALDGLCAVANRPVGADAGDAPRVERGLLRQWLVIGPFAVSDSVKDFDQDTLAGEASVEPFAGEKRNDREWKLATVPPDDIMVFGTAELPWPKSSGFSATRWPTLTRTCSRRAAGRLGSWSITVRE